MRDKVCLVLVSFVLGGLAGCYGDTFEPALYNEFPASRTDFRITANTEEKIESSLSNFARSHEYKLRVEATASGSNYSIIMWRADSMIYGQNLSGQELFEFGIYAVRDGTQSEEAMGQVLDELRLELAGK